MNHKIQYITAFFISPHKMMFDCMKNLKPYNLAVVRALSLSLSFVFLSFISLQLFNFYSPSSSTWLMSRLNSLGLGRKCDVFRGRWVYGPQETPYYTNFTCPEIFDQQNCMKFGRPDSDFLKWRWKPARCELGRFDAARFLEIVRGKSMAFVGDSLARNQMQSLLCLLSIVEYPTEVTNKTQHSKSNSWLFKDSNFTISTFWSPYLVKAEDTNNKNDKNHKRLTNLYLDQPNTNWTSHMKPFHYVIISAGRWFFGPKMFYDKGHVLGCHWCMRSDVKNYTMFYGYKRAFKTAFEALFRVEGFAGEVFLRTISPAHFEGGEWNDGGECKRTEPVRAGLNWADHEVYLSGVEVFHEVAREGERKGLKVRLLDVTHAMAARADGHPNHYGHWPSENVTVADCVHWCLPGPVDTWNELLLHMLTGPRR